MPCSQLVTMHACACDYAHLCHAVRLWLARAWAMHIYAMQSACDYACMCMWLFTSMSCSQIILCMLCIQLVIMNAWACDYAHLCCADSLWLCMHVHVIMHIYAMQPACNYVCKSLSYAILCHAVILWLCMPVHVIMHIYVMQSACNFARMSMWICMHVHVIMHIYGTQSDYNSARAWDMHIHAMQ